MQRFLRILTGLNVVLFASLLIATGSPTPLFRHSSIQNTIDDWWVLSTVAVVVSLGLLFVKKLRGKELARFLIDVLLTVTWVCLFVVIVLLGSIQFSAF